MKLYVFPVGKRCNARCGFCVTKMRSFEDVDLDVGNLERALLNIDVEKIEITGGGEPLLHREIGRIIDVCSEKTFVQLYTNGALAFQLRDDLFNLDLLCISRAHYDEKRNQEIMGIDYDLKKIRKIGIPLKFSLLLHKSGINSSPGVFEYLDWAQKSGVDSVVVREMIEENYSKDLVKEIVPAKGVWENMGIEHSEKCEEGSVFYCDWMKVVFKHSPIPCYKSDNLFLQANGGLGGLE